MDAKGSGVKSVVLLAWATLMTALTFVFGSAPLHALFKITGRGVYWLLTIGFSLLFFGLGFRFFGVSFFVISLTTGLFNEFKVAGAKIAKAGFYAVGISLSLLASGFYFWVRATGDNWFAVLEEKVTGFINTALQMNAETAAAVEAKEVIMHIPSAAAILLIVSLFVAVIFEKRLLLWVKMPLMRRERLSSFKLPDYCIWFFIVSLLGAFAKTDIQWVGWVSKNVLNVMLLLYFFQGLAIIVKYFEVFRIGFFWRLFWLTILVIQLFLMVSLIGVMDFWLDFRAKLVKKAKEIQDQQNKN